MEEEISFREKRIRAITQLYYSRPEVQKEIFEFSKYREISPRYFEGFGKRPDSFQYIGDIFGLVKNGATSFHCSEELWENPLDIKTGMSSEEANKLRIGWDLLIDIDSKYIDFSKIMATELISFLNKLGIQNIGIKFSGSKGFHLIIPWKAFPKFINGEDTKNLFPELPRIILSYLNFSIREKVTEKINQHLIKSEVGKEFPISSKYIKREKGVVNINLLKKVSSINMSEDTVSKFNENLMKIKNDETSFNKQVIPDIILVSPRHLFRMPYSLHEKTALASVVISKEELENFDLAKANPMNVKVKNFIPNSEENEATELVMQALDWAKSTGFDKEADKISQGKYADFKPIKLEGLKEEQFPPCVKKILLGMGDGKKRALFVLINLFRSVGMDKERMEKIIYEWNDKNKEPLKKAYIQSQLSWAYKRKPLLPPNCKDFYVDLGICNPDSLCLKIKNPVNYLVKSNLAENKAEKTKN